MNLPLRVLITGSSRGIGYQLVKIFLKSNPKAQIWATGIQTEDKGKVLWKGLDGEDRVNYVRLDVTSGESIGKLADKIAKNGVKIDVLVNNAGLGKGSQLKKPCPDYQFAKMCLSINTLGAMNLTEKLLPHLSESAKVVNIGSFYGGLRFHSKQVQKKFTDPNISKEDIQAFIEDYLREVKSGKMVNYTPIVYATSKMLLGAWSRFILQTKWLKKGQIAICTTPGLCLTSINDEIPQEEKAKAFPPENGAQKIHQTIFLKDLDPNVFYHRARKSTFQLCGKGLPWE